MKKIFAILMASVLMFASCGKDSPSKVLFQDSATIENVSYSMTIDQVEDLYSWTIVNSTDEVTTRYTYNYDSKNALKQDFAVVASELDQLDDTVLGTLLPMFTHEFGFIDNEDNSAVVSRTVKGGTVFVNFAFTTKSFSVPYTFVTAAAAKLNPEQE